MDMDTTWWLLGTGAALVLAALLGDRARRVAPLAWHAHLPWNAIVFAGLAVFLMQPFLVLAGFAAAHRTRLSFR